MASLFYAFFQEKHLIFLTFGGNIICINIHSA